MIKSKTKMSTLFVAILTIVTMLLGAMFMSTITRAPQSFSADGDSVDVAIGNDGYIDYDWEHYTVMTDSDRIATYIYPIINTGDSQPVYLTGIEGWHSEFYDPNDHTPADNEINCKEIKEVTLAISAEYNWISESPSENVNIIVPSYISLGGGNDCFATTTYGFKNYNEYMEDTSTNICYCASGSYKVVRVILDNSWGECTVTITLPSTLKSFKIGSGDSVGLTDVYYQGEYTGWDTLTGESSGECKILDEIYDYSGMNEIIEGLKIHSLTDEQVKTLSYENEAYVWSAWDDEPEPASEEPSSGGTGGDSDDNGGGTSGDSDDNGSGAPSTGIELNIGVAIASLALVGTLFVTVRRKEER